MKHQTLISAAIGIAVILGALACGGENNNASTGSDQNITGGGPAGADLSVDPQLVGKWTTDGADLALFHSLALNKDRTFHAIGGCKGQPGAAVCFAITEIDGTWTTITAPDKGSGGALNRQLLLTDQSGKVTTLYYSISGDTVTFSTQQGGATSIFEKEPDQRVAAGKVCTDQTGAPLECVDGFECRSNCPKGAMCLIQIMTCQPKLTGIQQGGVCGPSTNPNVQTSACADGLDCKSNCPADAKCIIEIDTCQPK
jgi:hypothetical protein